jgi:hypothetical protein
VASEPIIKFIDELSFCPERLKLINRIKAREVFLIILFPMFFIRKTIQIITINKAHNGKCIK